MPPAPTTPAALDMNQIQGNILAGFNKDFQAFLFLQFTDQTKGRAWLRNIAREVATTDEVLAFNKLFKRLNARRGGELGILKATWTNLAFTHAGLHALGVANAELSAFPDAYKQGMKARANVIGDVADSAPAKWAEPLKNAAIHAVLVVASDTQADLHQQTARYVQNLGFNGTVKLLFTQEGAVRQDEPGHEHFGFKDGVSQPGIRGLTTPDDPAKMDKGHPGQDLLWPGEFVLGYPTQDPTPGAGGDLNKVPGEVSETGPAWTKNGSFLVFRRLAQDVAAFRNFVAQQSAQTGISKEVLGAKMVGRHRSGAPLEQTDAMKAAGINPNVVDPGTVDLKFTTAKFDNDFEFEDDPDGKFVPRASHIRKVYTRDQEPPGESFTQTRRILRRGIPFGTSFRPSLGATSHGSAQAVFPHDRGLLFLCYQKSLEDQFEFLQQTWVNNANFPQSGDGQDPIIAQRDTPRTFDFPKPSGGQHAHLQLMKHFVVTTGGEYFFQPSIDALYHIAGVTPPAMPAG